MKLVTLNLEGFRCFKNKTVIPFHSLTVFIGENDSGKSTLLNAIKDKYNEIDVKKVMDPIYLQMKKENPKKIK